MNAEDLYNQFQENVTDTLSGAQSISGELQQLLRAAMTKTIAGLDIVSRDEFDAQQAVLLRSREKIDALEQQLTELEALLIIKEKQINVITREYKLHTRRYVECHWLSSKVELNWVSKHPQYQSKFTFLMVFRPYQEALSYRPTMDRRTGD